MFVMCCFYYYQKLQSFFLPNIDVAAPAKPVPKLGHCHQPAFLLSKLILQTKSFFCQYKKIVQNITIGRVDTFSILLDLLRVNQWCTTTTYNYIFFQTLAHQIKKNVFGEKWPIMKRTPSNWDAQYCQSLWSIGWGEILTFSWLSP